MRTMWRQGEEGGVYVAVTRPNDRIKGLRFAANRRTEQEGSTLDGYAVAADEGLGVAFAISLCHVQVEEKGRGVSGAVEGNEAL